MNKGETEFGMRCYVNFGGDCSAGSYAEIELSALKAARLFAELVNYFWVVLHSLPDGHTPIEVIGTWGSISLNALRIRVGHVAFWLKAVEAGQCDGYAANEEKARLLQFVKNHAYDILIDSRRHHEGTDAELVLQFSPYSYPIYLNQRDRMKLLLQSDENPTLKAQETN